MYTSAPWFLAIGSVGICLIPLAIVQGKWSEKIYKEQTKLKDDRVNVANEALGGIKLVKFYSWENPFEERIDNIRQTELKTMRKLKLVRDCGWLLWEIGPFLMERILSFDLELIFFIPKNNFEAFRKRICGKLSNVISNISSGHCPGLFILGNKSFVRVQKVLNQYCI